MACRSQTRRRPRNGAGSLPTCARRSRSMRSTRPLRKRMPTEAIAAIMPPFMDQLTKKIITILRRDGRASYADIPRELDTTRDNIASRVNPMFQSGELRVIAALHPRVLGLNVSAHISVKVAGDPHIVVRSLERLDSLAFISVTAGAYQLV